MFALRCDDGPARWKMIFDTGQLYDLSRDLAETTNLWHRHPDVVRALTASQAAHRVRPPPPSLAK